MLNENFKKTMTVKKCFQGFLLHNDFKLEKEFKTKVNYILSDYLQPADRMMFLKSNKQTPKYLHI